MKKDVINETMRLLNEEKNVSTNNTEDNENKEYILKYVTKNGEERELKYRSDKDMSTPQIINMIKNKDKDFFKLLENKKEEKTMNNLKEENNEQMDTLYDLLEYRDFEDIDIGDTTYDMTVTYSIDIEDADNDPAQEFLVRLAKSLRVITPLDIETLKTIDYVQVDLTKWVKDNFEVLESIFDFSATSKEEMIENIVIDGMEALIAGYTTNSVYEQLNKGAKFTESKQLHEEEELEGTEEDQTQTQEDVEQAISEVENPSEKEKFAVETSNSNIDVLIADEEQAIDGYKAFLKQAKETLIPSLYDVLEKEINEIIADEEDHINKLNTIKSAFHLEDTPLDESKKVENKLRP